MHIPISGPSTGVKLGGQRPIPVELAIQMVEDGVRLMHTYTAIDGTSLDTNPEKGKVEFSTPGRFGNIVTAAEFRGDVYEGSLSINRDQRGSGQNRFYEFNREHVDEVIITDHVPTFHKAEMNVYRIKGSQGTVERVVVD
jgi:hypothetical protein